MSGDSERNEQYNPSKPSLKRERDSDEQYNPTEPSPKRGKDLARLLERIRCLDEKYKHSISDNITNITHLDNDLKQKYDEIISLKKKIKEAQDIIITLKELIEKLEMNEKNLEFINTLKGKIEEQKKKIQELTQQLIQKQEIFKTVFAKCKTSIPVLIQDTNYAKQTCKKLHQIKEHILNLTEEYFKICSEVDDMEQEFIDYIELDLCNIDDSDIYDDDLYELFTDDDDDETH